MYLKGSKWSMNRRRQHFNWFRIAVLTLLIAAGLYLDRVVIPAAPALFSGNRHGHSSPEVVCHGGAKPLRPGQTHPGDPGLPAGDRSQPR